MHGLGRNRQPSTLNTNLESYDNKLVSSTLVNSVANEPISPISSVFSSSAQNPSSSNNPFSSAHHSTNVGLGVNVNHILHPTGSSSSLYHNNHHYSYNSSHPYTNNALPPGSSGRGFRTGTSAAGLTSAISLGGSTRNVHTHSHGGTNNNINNDSHPSHPSSPWSVVTLTVLPVFNGTPLLTPIEDLNALVSAHITSSIARSPQAYHSLLSSDLQEIISSGMLTLKAKLDPVLGDREGLKGNPARLAGRVAEVWAFFFGIVPYMQGIFLPLSLLSTQDPSKRNIPGSYSNEDHQPHGFETEAEPEITTEVRKLLLSGFLVHILLPILPRLLDSLDVARYGPGLGNGGVGVGVDNDHGKNGRASAQGQVRPGESESTNLNSPRLNSSTSGDSNSTSTPSFPAPPTHDQLGRLQHMALIISTQAKRSCFFSFEDNNQDHDDQHRSKTRTRTRTRSRTGSRTGSRQGRARSRSGSEDGAGGGGDSDYSEWQSSLRLDPDEIDRDRVEDLLRAVVRLKSGGVDPTLDSHDGTQTDQRMFGLMRSSNVAGSSASTPGSNMEFGMGMGNVPRPRRRGYFSGVALRSEKKEPTRYPSGSSRAPSRATSRSRDRQTDRDRGSRSAVESSDDEGDYPIDPDESGSSLRSRRLTDESGLSRPKSGMKMANVDKWGASTTVRAKDGRGDTDQTPTITDLGRRIGRMELNTGNENGGEDTVKPRVV